MGLVSSVRRDLKDRFMQRITIGSKLEISRIVTGLWQVADMERGGTKLDPLASAKQLVAYAAEGFDSFDMADHYGSAEDITGAVSVLRQKNQAPDFRAFTKWCPGPGPMTAEAVRAAVDLARTRMLTSRIDLLQFHWWMYEHPAYIDALRHLAALREEGAIGEIGLTNFNTDHLQLVLETGVPAVTNQVCFSLLDRRAAGRMSEVCARSGVKLLAYGTLGGGFLSERYLNQPEPADINDYSKMKYGRFIAAIGGWEVLQNILQAASRIAKRHKVSIANVATRWCCSSQPLPP